MQITSTPKYGLPLSREFRERPLQARINAEENSHHTGRMDRIDALQSTGADTIGGAYDKLAEEAYRFTLLNPDTKMVLGGLGLITGLTGLAVGLSQIGQFPPLAIGAFATLTAATAVGGSVMHHSGQTTATARELVYKLEGEELDSRDSRPSKQEKAQRAKYRKAHQGGALTTWNVPFNK